VGPYSKRHAVSEKVLLFGLTSPDTRADGNPTSVTSPVITDGGSGVGPNFASMFNGIPKFISRVLHGFTPPLQVPPPVPVHSISEAPGPPVAVSGRPTK
jgi:hypothetical protein